MFNYKKYIIDIIKSTSVIVSMLFLGIWAYVSFSLNIPSSVPSGTESGGSFSNNFNKAFQDCGPGMALRGYDSSKNKICSYLPVDGSCGSSRGSCNTGNLTWTNSTSSCGTTATWTCNGLYGGDSVSCSYDNGPCPINGSCGGSRGTCSSGSMSWTNSTSSCGTSATWSCNGLYGGSSASCSEYNGSCCASNYGDSCTYVGGHSWSFSCQWHTCSSPRVCSHPGGSISSCSEDYSGCQWGSLKITGSCRDEYPGTYNCSGVCVKN